MNMPNVDRLCSDELPLEKTPTTKPKQTTAILDRIWGDGLMLRMRKESSTVNGSNKPRAT